MKPKHLIQVAALTCAMTATAPAAQAEGFGARVTGGVTGAFGGSDFTPYYISANSHGRLSTQNDALVNLGAELAVRPSRRVDIRFGVDVIGGYTGSVDYMRWHVGDGADAPGGWNTNPRYPSRLWLQQLYGRIDYRGVFLTAGMKEHSSALLDSRLSSGDLVESGNARPIPEVRVGFNDFQNIPFTRGWVQIQGELSYGKMADNGWLKDHYNYYEGHINLGALYSYKRCYFRTMPSQPLSVTVGMQVGAFFGGETAWYSKGVKIQERKFSKGIGQFFRMLVPTDGGKDYYQGSSLGSWDLLARYRLKNGAQVRAYMQKPWEDGSGIGFLNGFDGLWGLEYRAARPGIVSAVVVEYLDFTNQSGPLHWDPDDEVGTDITTRAEGNDNYYNNYEYNSYANYGMAIGTPFLPSPVYNTDGHLQFADTRVRGFHVGVEGIISPEIGYRLLGGYRKGWGTARVPLKKPVTDTSLMVEASYTPRSLSALKLTAQLAMDAGSMFGDKVGAALSVTYTGDFSLGR